MEKCKKFTKHKYRVFEHYFGKFDNIQAICDCPDIETAERIINVFNSFYENRPFKFFLKEIED